MYKYRSTFVNITYLNNKNNLSGTLNIVLLYFLEKQTR